MAAWRSFNFASKVSVSPAVTAAIHKIGSTLATALNSQRDTMPVFGRWTCRYFLPEPIKCTYPKCFVLNGFGWDCPFLIPCGLLSHRVKSAQACWDCERQKSCRVAPKKKLEFLHRLKVLWYFDNHVWNLAFMLMFMDVKWGEKMLEVENTGCLRHWQRFGGLEVERGWNKNIYMHLQEITWIPQINKKSLLSILIKWSKSFHWAEAVCLYMSGICFSERTKDCLHQLTLIGFACIFMIFICYLTVSSFW